MSDLIDRNDAVEAIEFEKVYMTNGYVSEGNPLKQYNKGLDNAIKAVNNLLSAEPDNQVHLCDFCKYDYPECLTEWSDVIFGNGVGHDNICACTKFEIKQEQKKGKWIDEPYKRWNAHSIRHCSSCGWSIHKSHLRQSDLHWNYCPNCGADMRDDK